MAASSSAAVFFKTAFVLKGNQNAKRYRYRRPRC